MPQTEPRFCPMCGRVSDTLRCPNDGAITVLKAKPASTARFAPGHVINQRYEISGIVGHGGFGVVYRGVHVGTGQEVAVKVLNAEAAGERHEAAKRFEKEGRVLARLQHPATVRIFDVGVTADGAPFMAMELVDGPNVEQVLAHLSAQGRAFSEAQAIDMMLPVLGSLTEAHGLGLVHRDLKPANIMLTEVADEPLVVKVVDFGVVRTHDSDLTTRQSSIGTPRYMSPEQCRGDGVDARSDLYALGCVLFEAVTGEPPFSSASHVDTMYLQMSAKVPDVDRLARSPVSEGFKALVYRALAKEPSERFPTAGAMRRALARLRQEAWRNVPVTPLHTLLNTDGAGAWRVIVDGGSGGGETQAGVRTGGERTEITPVTSAPSDDILAAAQRVIDTHVDGHAGALAAAAAAAQAGTEIPKFRPNPTLRGLGDQSGRRGAGRPVDSAQPASRGEAAEGPPAGRRPYDPSPSQEWVQVARKGELQVAIAAVDALASEAQGTPNADAAARQHVRPASDGRLPFDASESQELVPLPSRRRLEAALAARLAAEASAAPPSAAPTPDGETRVEAAPGAPRRSPSAPRGSREGGGERPTVTDLPDEPVRHVQVAPALKRDAKRGTRRWAKGTLLGTGVTLDDDED